MLCIGVQLKIRYQEKSDLESIATCNALLLKRVLFEGLQPFSMNTQCNQLSRAQLEQLDSLQIRNNLSPTDFPEISAFALLDAEKAIQQLNQKSNPIDPSVHLYSFYSWRNGSKHWIIQPMKLIPMTEMIIQTFTKSLYSKDNISFTIHASNQLPNPFIHPDSTNLELIDKRIVLEYPLKLSPKK